jgi:hypothetical protein
MSKSNLAGRTFFSVISEDFKWYNSIMAPLVEEVVGESKMVSVVEGHPLYI